MITRNFLCNGLLAMSFCAFSQGASSASAFSKTKWMVSGGYCPVGCPVPVADFIKSQVGFEVTLSNSEFSAPFLDKCAGRVHYKYEVMDADRLASALSRGQSKATRFTRKNMKIQEKKVLTAVALCNGNGSDSTMARILSIEPGGIRILFEEQSIIELR